MSQQSPKVVTLQVKATQAIKHNSAQLFKKNLSEQIHVSTLSLVFSCGVLFAWYHSILTAEYLQACLISPTGAISTDAASCSTYIAAMSKSTHKIQIAISAISDRISYFT